MKEGWRVRETLGWLNREGEEERNGGGMESDYIYSSTVQIRYTSFLLHSKRRFSLFNPLQLSESFSYNMQVHVFHAKHMISGRSDGSVVSKKVVGSNTGFPSLSVWSMHVLSGLIGDPKLWLSVYVWIDWQPV